MLGFVLQIEIHFPIQLLFSKSTINYFLLPLSERLFFLFYIQHVVSVDIKLWKVYYMFSIVFLLSNCRPRISFFGKYRKKKACHMFFRHSVYFTVTTLYQIARDNISANTAVFFSVIYGISGTLFPPSWLQC